MTRKRKPFYPPAKTGNKRAPAPGSDASPERPNLVTIDSTAGMGRPGLAVGERVRINASGLFAGEVGVIERLSVGVIPSAFVRTESGGSRQVRTVDLEPTETQGDSGA